MPEAQEAFDALTRVLHAEVLKPAGFAKSKGLFRRRTDEAWLLVEFQKSQKSDRSLVTFTVNLGIALLAIRDADGEEGAPTIGDSHWSERLGFLLPEHTDTWWTIGSSHEVDRLRDQLVLALRDVALPALAQYATTDALATLWETGVAPGLTDVQRARCLRLARGVSSTP